MLNNNKFTFVNVYFQHKHNEVKGHYRQTIYLVPIHKVRVWDRMFYNKACAVLNNNKFTFVNVCFQYKHNEVRGHYRQTLVKNRVLGDIGPRFIFIT